MRQTRTRPLRRASAVIDKLGPLVAAVAANPRDYDARLALAEAQVGMDAGAAIDTLLDLVREAPAWNDGAARKKLLAVFDTVGASHPAVIAGRKRLSKLLFR